MVLTAIDLLWCWRFNLWFKKAGFEVKLGVELEHVAAETYRVNHPEHQLYEADIRTLDPYAIMLELNIKPVN